MKSMQIPISKPYFDESDKSIIQKPLESGWVVQGAFVAEFENLFASFTQSKYAIASSNCTTALQLGLVALGITKGKRIVIPSFTYIASANAAIANGANVLFCDIDRQTFNIDTNSLERILSSQNVDAIMPVHLFGLCADMPTIMQLAQAYNAPKIIEDAACGFDSWITDRHSGTFGDCGCFSFHPRKAITTGEGGMLITNNADINTCTRALRDHGASLSDLQRHKIGGSLLPEFNMAGFNYRLTDIQGALGVTQMQKAKDIMAKRRFVANAYINALKDHPFLLPPLIPHDYTHGFQSFVCLFGGSKALEANTIDAIDKLNEKRNLFMQKLQSKGIATRQGTHAVHTLGFYKQTYNLKYQDYINAYAADRLSISLPLYADMTETEIDYVISTLKEN